MGRWLWGFSKRFVVFTIAAIGLGQAYSWVFGYEEEVKLWLSENRAVTALTLVLSAIMYAMYDWLEEQER